MPWKNLSEMRVLITGAGGFIGSRVVRFALSGKHAVTAVVRRRADVARLKDQSERLHIIECDLCDGSRLRQVIRESQPELAVHLAWYAEPGKYWTSPQNLDCVSMTLTLAKALKESGCRRLVAAGTCAEYDWSQQRMLEEDGPLRPRSLYGIAKNAARSLVEAFCAECSVEFVWTRFFYLYGPGEPRKRLVPSIIVPLLQNLSAPTSNGEAIRDFLHVDDAAAAVWATAESDLVGAVNIASGQGIKVRDIVAMIGQLLGREKLIRWGALSDDPCAYPVVASITRLRNNTAWRPRWDLESGLANTISWWREQCHETCPVTQ